MKKISVFLIMIILLFFTSCDGISYSFKNTIDEIKSIEIVEAKNSREYTVLKTLSELEKEDFIKRFEEIIFHRWFFGDPLSVSGKSVKITYVTGDYEIVCYRWAEYVNADVYFIRRYCDKEEFNELLDLYLK